MSRYIYLVRHGEQQNAEHGMPDGPLSERGEQQARLIADRLGEIPFTGAWHSPLRRASETANIIAERMPGVEWQPSSLLFDCVPSGPTPDMPKNFDSFFGSFTPAEIEAGEAQMADAIAEFLVPSAAERHDLLVTHNFVIAYFVRHALDAPKWRWLGLNQANCGLTVIWLRTARPPMLILHNDLGHLPVHIRTGTPEAQPF